MCEKLERIFMMASRDPRGVRAIGESLLPKLSPAICLLFVLLGRPSLASENRDALWQVVQACLANHAVTGAAFPCLEVNVSGGVAAGYSVLRPPLGKQDTILTPTRRIVGIEDLSLQAADAPNYFEDAWNARAFLSDGAAGPPAREDVALVLNSRLTRSQDQLHIHLGCISGQAKRWLQAVAPDLSQTRWMRLKRPIGGLVFWARRLAQDNLVGVNPVRLVATGLLREKEDIGLLTILIVGTGAADGHGGFILLAARTARPRDAFLPTAENALDPSCSSRESSGLSKAFRRNAA
jgi:CDP-diacylglycerol pyrophosphatase